MGGARASDEPAVAAYVLSGLSGGRVDSQAASCKTRSEAYSPVFRIDGYVSWRLRLDMMRDASARVARSLVGVPNTDAARTKARVDLAGRPREPKSPHPLSGLDDDSAWEIRERSYERHPDAVTASLARLASGRAWEMRERWLSTRDDQLRKDYELASIAARAVTAVGDERAWALRTAAREAAPISALKSVGELVDPTSWQWRAALLGSAPRPVMQTLRNIRTRQAWEMRELAAPGCKEVLDSIFGMDDPKHGAAQWYADIWPSTVVKSLDRSRCRIEASPGCTPASAPRSRPGRATTRKCLRAGARTRGEH